MHDEPAAIDGLAHCRCGTDVADVHFSGKPSYRTSRVPVNLRAERVQRDRFVPAADQAFRQGLADETGATRE